MKFVDISKFLEKNTTYNILLRFITLSYYRKIVKREIKLGSIVNNDNVLCIGGGYFPATAILIAKLTNCKVTVIDNDLNTIKVAKDAIRILKLEQNVEVVYSEGKMIDAKDFDVVTIANQISPKFEVYSRVKETICFGRILVRKPKKYLKNGYHEENFELDGLFINQPFYSNIERTILNVT